MPSSDATILQDNLVEKANESLAAGKNVIIDAPTGSGKSRMFTCIAEQQAQKGAKTLILSNRRNLVHNTITNIEKWGTGKVSASTGIDGVLEQDGAIVASTVQTANERIDELQRYDIAIIDEAHHARKGNDDYERLVTVLYKANPDIRIIGASATFPPESSKLLEPLQNADRHIITFEEAIAARLIDLPRTITPNPTLIDGRTLNDHVDRYIDTSGQAKDEKFSGLATQIEKNLPADWVETQLYYYEKHLSQCQTIAFFDTVKEAEAFTKLAKTEGHDVEIIHSGRKASDNDQALERFKANKKGLIVSIDMISEGFDVDARGILLCKKRTSNDEFRQIIGRSSRSFGETKSERSVLVDLGASTRLHGDIVVQARVSQVRLGSREEPEARLAPESGEKNGIWKHVPDKEPNAWATAIDGRIIYAIPTEQGYLAFESKKDRKGQRLEMLTIEGEKKGRPTKPAFLKWATEAIRRNERALARMVSSASVDNLDQMIKRDWERHSSSIKSAYSMIVLPPTKAIAQPALAMAQSMGR